MWLASVFEDQAEGLRRLFVADSRRMIALMSVCSESAVLFVAGLARVLASQGKKVLVLDEFWAAGEPHPVFGLIPKHDLASVMLASGEVENALQHSAEGIDLLAGATHAHMPRPRMEARIGLVNAFYRLAGRYDVILVNASAPAHAHPSFAWACHDVILLADGSEQAAKQVYALIKLLHQAQTRRFHLLYQDLEADRSAALFKGVAAVSRRHLHLMPEYLGVLPRAEPGRTSVFRHLALALQNWPMPEHKAGNFPELMRRLLRGADVSSAQSALK